MTNTWVYIALVCVTDQVTTMYPTHVWALQEFSARNCDMDTLIFARVSRFSNRVNSQYSRGWLGLFIFFLSKGLFIFIKVIVSSLVHNKFKFKFFYFS